jgi:hypothetical protein
MSAQQHPDDDGDEQDAEETNRDFWDAVNAEGVTIDGDFYMTTGTGRSTRYHRYDPNEVAGFDAVRGEDGEIVTQEVAGHEDAVVEDLNKSDLETVADKYEQGFGIRGPAEIKEGTTGGGGSGGGSGGGAYDDYEPLDDEELKQTIVENFEDNGGTFFAEDDDGDTKVVSLAHPEGRLMGYITGSHVGALPADSIETVDDYRRAVHDALDLPEDTSPDDVPICDSDMMETFKEAGSSIAEERREEIAEQVSQRWEDGEYDHLRQDDSDDGGDGEDEQQ